MVHAFCVSIEAINGLGGALSSLDQRQLRSVQQVGLAYFTCL